jgi:hypothetical protein
VSHLIDQFKYSTQLIGIDEIFVGKSKLGLTLTVDHGMGQFFVHEDSNRPYPVTGV